MRDTDLSRGSAVEMFEHTNRDKAWLEGDRSATPIVTALVCCKPELSDHITSGYV